MSVHGMQVGFLNGEAELSASDRIVTNFTIDVIHLAHLLLTFGFCHSENGQPDLQAMSILVQPMIYLLQPMEQDENPSKSESNVK